MKPATLALSVLLAATACGGGGGSGGDDGGTGVPRPREFGTDRTRVRVVPHETFVLKVPYRPSEGYGWVVRGKRPDRRILTRLSTTSHGFTPDRPGDRGERWYTFRAERHGSTEFTLRECFGCGAGRPEGDVPGGDRPVRDVTFRVTVVDRP
ncbi:protease inhibitor I42 family protein [Streptomyces sp. NPDC007083]|uniref:protease inhibitor I42 family protein n=1 Tax=unclassified Streptomyces TaxID=2593676 RepID=UPI0033CC533D